MNKHLMNINGKDQKPLAILYGSKVIHTYESIVDMAGGRDKRRNGTVFTVSFSCDDKDGTLVPGERVHLPVGEKSIWNVTVTGNG